jgi:hypothetical protein
MVRDHAGGRFRHLRNVATLWRKATGFSPSQRFGTGLQTPFRSAMGPRSDRWRPDQGAGFIPTTV